MELVATHHCGSHHRARQTIVNVYPLAPASLARSLSRFVLSCSHFRPPAVHTTRPHLPDSPALAYAPAITRRQVPHRFCCCCLLLLHPLLLLSLQPGVTHCVTLESTPHGNSSSSSSSGQSARGCSPPRACSSVVDTPLLPPLIYPLPSFLLLFPLHPLLLLLSISSILSLSTTHQLH